MDRERMFDEKAVVSSKFHSSYLSMSCRYCIALKKCRDTLK